MDTIIPPGNTQLITSEHHRDRSEHHKERCATPEQLAIASMESRQLTEAEGVEGRDVTENFGFQNLNAAAATAVETRSDIGRALDISTEQIRQFGIANLSSTTAQSEATRDAVVSSADKNRDSTEFYGFHNHNATKDGVKDILLQNCCDTASIKAQEASDFKDLLLQASNNAAAGILEAAKNTSAIIVDSTKNAAAAALAAAVNTADIRLEMCKSTGELKLQASQDKAFLELQAAKNTAQLEARIAECCCENRLLVTEKAAHTDALIRKLDEDRYKDELQRTRDALIALQVRSTIPPLPVAATPIGGVV